MSDRSIAVVGGGVIGASVAYYLSERGDDAVTVYEKGSLGAETTAKSAAHMGYFGGSSRTYIRMQRRAVELYNRLLSEARSDAAYVMTGRLLAATSEDGREEVVRRYHRERRRVKTENGGWEATAELFTGDQLRSAMLLPALDLDAVTAAHYNPNTGFVRNPGELAYEFGDRAEANGVTVEEHTEVTGIRTDGGAVTGIETEGGRVDADRVVVAAGPWTPRILSSVGVDVPAEYILPHVVQLEPERPSPHFFPSLQHWATGTWYRQNGDGTVFGYATDNTDPDPDPDEVRGDPDPDVVDTIRESVETLTPHLADATVVDEYRAVYTHTPDSNPVAGPTAIDGLSVAMSGASGVALAPTIGEVLAGIVVDGDYPDYYQDISPDRLD
jgi:sarcosine oxidase subunit beta